MEDLVRLTSMLAVNVIIVLRTYAQAELVRP